MAVCENCKKRPAKIHYTEIVNGKIIAVELCVECAEEKGIDVNKAGPYGLGDLVAGLIDTAVDGDVERIGRVRCPTCGYQYSDFKKVGRFGCPDCYDAFEVQLKPLLRHVHGATQHSGKRPPKVTERAAARRRKSELQEELARAIAAEDYERAAVIRDEISGMKEPAESPESSEGDE